MIYEYDNHGNITRKKKYTYQYGTSTTSLKGTPVTTNYEYNDNIWGDLLTNYNGKTITYDESGNPIEIKKDNYNYILLDWEGRQLVKYTEYKAGNIYQIISYRYNDSGYRTYKKVDKLNGNYTEYNYYLDGSLVIYEEIKYYENNELRKTDKIYYTYDIDGTLISMNLNEEEYFYIRNLQGDIVNIVDNNGNIQVTYRYDAWGEIIYQTDNDLARINPYRYRGYRYDEETGLYYLYYLNSRYFNPEIGRDINAKDVSEVVTTSINGANLLFIFS